MLYWLVVLAMCLSATQEDIRETTFTLVVNPSAGPCRLDTAWTSPSIISCAVLCRTRYSERCELFVYNQATQLCTPATWAHQGDPIPNEIEDQIYQLYNTDTVCNSTGGFELHIFKGTRICVANFNVWVDYWDATEKCRLVHSTIYIIKSEIKFAFYRNYISDAAWVGLDDLIEEGTFVWADDGQILNQTLANKIFARGEPNNAIGIEHCVEINPSQNFYLNDDICTTIKQVVCERRLCGDADCY